MVHLVYHAKLCSIHSEYDKIFDREFKKLLQELSSDITVE